MKSYKIVKGSTRSLRTPSNPCHRPNCGGRLSPTLRKRSRTAVWAILSLTPTPTRQGADAIANADFRGAGVIADAFAGAISANSMLKFEGAVMIVVAKTPTPTRLGAEVTANADYRGLGVIADANAGAILADSM